MSDKEDKPSELKPESGPDWAVYFRIGSALYSLKELAMASSLVPENGSFSKGEPVPKWLQPLEKTEFYPVSRLQIGFDLPDRITAEQYIADFLARNSGSFVTARELLEDAITCELAIQSSERIPVYLFIAEEVVKRCAQAGIALRFAVI